MKCMLNFLTQVIPKQKDHIIHKTTKDIEVLSKLVLHISHKFSRSEYPTTAFRNFYTLYLLPTMWNLYLIF